MAELKTAIVPLTGKNYPTWKVQCKMALMKDSLWGIVAGSETLSRDANADTRKKFEARKDKALAIVVLAVDPSHHFSTSSDIRRIPRSSGRG